MNRVRFISKIEHIESKKLLCQNLHVIALYILSLNKLKYIFNYIFDTMKNVGSDKSALKKYFSKYFL